MMVVELAAIAHPGAAGGGGDEVTGGVDTIGEGHGMAVC